MTTDQPDRFTPCAREAALEVYLLGRVDFDAALTLMDRLVFDISGRDDRQGALLLCEHPPLIAMGREASISQVRADQHALTASEIDIRWIARGGTAVMHAPGQLAVYPILPLDRLGFGLDDYRNRLEQALQAVCHDLRVPARRRDNEPGLWGRSGQLASFAGAVKSWVSLHGMFLNVHPEPSLLKMVAVGPDGECTSSLQADRLRRVSMTKVRQRTIEHLTHQFGYERFHVYTGHPLLSRTSQKVCLHA